MSNHDDVLARSGVPCGASRPYYTSGEAGLEDSWTDNHGWLGVAAQVSNGPSAAREWQANVRVLEAGGTYF